MKICLALILILSVTASNAQDIRDEFDALLLQLIDDITTYLSQFVARVSHQLTRYQNEKLPDQRDQILAEINFVTPLSTSVQNHIRYVENKTGLSIEEKYLLDKLSTDFKVVSDTLRLIQTEVNKVTPIKTNTTNTTVNWRQEYDSLLFELIEERITLGDSLLLNLQQQLAEYKKNKDPDVKERIIVEVDTVLPFVRLAQDHARRELNRTDLNVLERFLYEKANDQITLLIRHYNAIETAVKQAFIYYASAPNTTFEWRQAYDSLLFEYIEIHVRRADYFLVRLFRQYQRYLDTRNETFLDEIVTEVDEGLPILESVRIRAADQLKRTDLNDVEKYLWEKTADEVALLSKYWKQIENLAKGARPTTPTPRPTTTTPRPTTPTPRTA